MKSYRIIITQKANADLDNIFEYIAQDNVATAKAFVKDLTAKIYHLAEIGATGSSRSWIRPNLRAFPYRERCFYFIIEQDCLVLLRILSDFQDINKQEF